MKTQDTGKRMPMNDLDLQMMVTDPAWSDELTPDLKKKLQVKARNSEALKIQLQDKVDAGIISEEEASILYKQDIKKELSGLLGYYKRDLRLGNLSRINGEYDRVVAYLDMAGDCLDAGLSQSFILFLRRAINPIEVSQSKGGFLRKLFSTARIEHANDSNDDKRGFFGGKKE